MKNHRIEISNDQRMLIACALLYYANRDSVYKDDECDIKDIAEKFSFPENTHFNGFNHVFHKTKE